MSKAADNEKYIRKELEEIGIELKGKTGFKEKIANNSKEYIIVSVDESLNYKNRNVLIEIDSYNMAKVVVGQYTILNSLLKQQKVEEEYIFVVVHCYKDYNPLRTKKNLDYINKSVLNEEGIPYKIYSQKEFIDLCRKFPKTEDLVNALYEQEKN